MDGHKLQPFSFILLVSAAVMIAGVVVFSGSEGFSQSAATIIDLTLLQRQTAEPPVADTEDSLRSPCKPLPTANRS